MIGKLFNLTLRLGGMGSKFILLALLSKYLTTEKYGEFSLIATTVTMLIYVLGLDFYNYLIREIVVEKDNRVNKLLNSFMLYVLIYLLFFVIFYVIKSYFGFDDNLFLLIFIISITEHLSQEFYRIQIALKKITFANVQLFARVFGYSASIIIYYSFSGEISIKSILKIWALFNSLVLIVSLVEFYYRSEIIFSVIPDWLRKGLKTSMFFFGSTIFLKLIEYSNRYIIAIFLSNSDVGIFSFYSNIAIMVTVYVNTIVVSYKLPELLEYSNTPEIGVRLKKVKKELFIQSGIGFLLSVILVLVFLEWQGKIEFKDSIYLFGLLGFSTILSNTSLVYYFEMYITNNERKIMYSTVKSGIFTIVVTTLLIYLFGMSGAGIAAVLSALALLYYRKKETEEIKI